MICCLRLFCKENSFSSAFLGTDSYDTLFQAADGIDHYAALVGNEKQGRSSNGNHGSDLGRSSFFQGHLFFVAIEILIEYGDNAIELLKKR